LESSKFEQKDSKYKPKLDLNKICKTR